MISNIRIGIASDQEKIIDFMLMAGEGIFEQMFQFPVPGMGPRQALRIGLNDRKNAYFLENATLVEDGSKILGCLLAFPESEYGLPAIIRNLIPNKRLKPLNPLFASRLPGSFYINTLAVREDARGQGVGRLLLDVANEMAAESGYESLSLHAWSDNAPAMALYRNWGFELVEEIDIPKTKHLKHDGPITLLKAQVSNASENS